MPNPESSSALGSLIPLLVILGYIVAKWWRDLRGQASQTTPPPGASTLATGQATPLANPDGLPPLSNLRDLMAAHWIAGQDRLTRLVQLATALQAEGKTALATAHRLDPGDSSHESRRT